jgi:hypothetical protein
MNSTGNENNSDKYNNGPEAMDLNATDKLTNNK